MANSKAAPTEIHFAWGWITTAVETSAIQLEWALGVLTDPDAPHWRREAAIDRLTKTQASLASLVDDTIEASDAYGVERLSNQAEARAHSRIS
jgi:hypothetical protein